MGERLVSDSNSSFQKLEKNLSFWNGDEEKNKINIISIFLFNSGCCEILETIVV